MLQNIKKQGLKTLQKVLKHLQSQQSSSSTDNKTTIQKYTNQEYANSLLENKILKTEHQKMILILCLESLASQEPVDKAKSKEDSQQQQSQNTFTSKEFTQKIRSIKISFQQNDEQQQSILQIPPSTKKKVQQFQPQQQEYDIIGTKSRQLKKQNQIIKRNVKAIKKIPSSFNQGINVEEHPQYFRINCEISKKLYQKYSKCSVGVVQQGAQLTFDNRQRFKQTLNYHKIMQIFADAKIKVAVEQKLHILRTVKKHCFNQQFINLEEWNKIYKVIVHSLGFKEHIFQKLLGMIGKKGWEPSLSDSTKMIPLSGSRFTKQHYHQQLTKAGNLFDTLNPIKNQSVSLQKTQFRSRRIKTQTGIGTGQFYSTKDVIETHNFRNRLKATSVATTKNIQSNYESEKLNNPRINTNFHHPPPPHSQHKTLINDISPSFLKQVKKKDANKAQKIVGVSEKKRHISGDDHYYQGQDTQEWEGGSYLKKAMNGKKISNKITWQSLSNMNESNLLCFVKIPEFAKHLEQ